MMMCSPSGITGKTKTITKVNILWDITKAPEKGENPPPVLFHICPPGLILNFNFWLFEVLMVRVHKDFQQNRRNQCCHNNH